MTDHKTPTQPLNSQKSFSLRFKVMVLVTSLVCVQSILAFYFVNDLIKKYHGQEELALVSAHDQFAGSLADLLYERYGDVQAFAINPHLQGADTKSMTDALNLYTSLYQIYQGILFYNLSGKLVAGNSKGPDGKPNNLDALRKTDVSNEIWFQAAIKEQYTQDKDKGIGGTYVGPISIDPLAETLTGKPAYGFHFSTLVKNSAGRPIGVITSRADIDWLESEAKQSTDHLKDNGLSSMMIEMVDENGKLIFDFDPQDLKNGKRDFSLLGKLNVVEKGGDDAKRALQGESGVMSTTNARKQSKVVSAFSKIKDPKFPSSLNWAVLLQAEGADLFAVENASMQKFYLAFFIVLAASLALGYFYTTSLSRHFGKVSLKLKESAERTTRVALDLNAGAGSAASSVAEQAAAVQETVASMAEMSSMIAQTSQNVRESMNLAQTANEKTEEGNRIMQRLVGSMDSIQQANGQLQNIGKVIAEITNKTAVINDIVFKTQLLSFNASIEAARAGQHGRGFAVVAAEVGNLAQMSGNAAKEIQTLLDDSRAQVQSILESTQSRVSEGQMVSAEALSTFGEISKSIEGISSQIRSINEATREQDIGVKQTTTAMVQMDEYAQKNNVVSQQVASLALETQKEAEHLFRIMQASRILVEGSAAFNKAPETRDIVDSLIDDRSLAVNSPQSPHSVHSTASNSNPVEKSSQHSSSSSLVDRIVSKAKERNSEHKNTPDDINHQSAEISADDDTFHAA